MNIRLLKRVDAVFGRFLAHLLPATGLPAPLAEPRTILCIRPGGIGDAALLAPFISALRTRFSGARIVVLAEKRNAGVLPLVPHVDQVLCYDVPRELLAALRLKPDLVIDTEQYHRLSAVVARLTGAATRIGYATNERARLFHHPVPYSHEEYEADSFLGLLQPLGIEPLPRIETPFLAVPAPAAQRAREMLAFAGSQPLLAVFPGASIPERRWGAERFHAVANHFADRGRLTVVVGGPEDAEAGAAIVNGNGGMNLAGRTSLMETAGILACTELLISGDSGVLHLGVGLGRPTVSLFGPGIEKKWAPSGARHRVLNLHHPCSPCTRFGTTRACPTGAACLKGITPSMVIEAAASLLSS